jgi:AraC-like DNA-binding protein
MIREQHYNYTEIAWILGYTSIHYFSRDFKKTAGMSPSESARTVKARSPKAINSGCGTFFDSFDFILSDKQS